MQKILTISVHGFDGHHQHKDMERDGLIISTYQFIPEHIGTDYSCFLKSDFYEKIVYLPCTAENDFFPDFPKQKVDLIYICSPNNPTGTVFTRNQLKQWVNYAKQNHAIILFLRIISM